MPCHLTLGLREEPERGTSMGARQEGGVGPEGCQRPGPARPGERASLCRVGQGHKVPTSASERMRRGCCWGMALSTA